MEKYNNYISIPAGKSGKVSLVHKVRRAGTKLSTANMRCKIFGSLKSEDLLYKEETTWHSLQEEDQGVWMTDDPCEQAQMRDCIKDFKGTVLVGGLGLGIVAKMLAGNEAVKEIVVVEKSQDIINLVWNSTLAATDTSKAILQVVCQDLFEYLEETEKIFDNAIYDIWQSDGEYTFFRVVLPLRQLSEGKVVDEIVCWNEDVMRGQINMNLQHRTMGVFHEEFAKVQKKSCKELLDFFCTEDDDFVIWARPFFQWIKDTKPEEEEAQDLVPYYASIYGTEYWQERWEDEIG